MDSLCILPEMTNEQAGIFIKAIYHFQSTGEILPLDFGMKMAITPFLNQFIRDDEAYADVCEGKSLRGKIGNLKRWHPDLYSKLNENQSNIDELWDIAKNRTSDNSEQQGLIPIDIIPKSLDSKNDNKNDSKKINIEERKKEFAKTLEPYLVKYGREMLNDFYAYWTEPNKSNTKFRQEQEKNWDLSRRLSTWEKNNKTFGAKTEQTDPYAPRKGNFKI